MWNLVKVNVFLWVFIIFSSFNSYASEQILPIKKPSINKETKAKKVKSKKIYPEKKPSAKKEELKIELASEELKTTDDIEKERFIYPLKKPLIVRKKIDKVVEKSSVFSKRDFEIAKATFNAIDNKKWTKALKLSKKAKDKSLFKLVNWLYLIKTSNAASFYDYVSFINTNPDYPRISRLKYLAEHKINLKTSSPRSIINWFNGQEPLSDFGKIKLGEIYLIQGNYEKGSQLIKEGWIKARLSKANLRYLRKKYKKIITVADNIKRADWHAWEGKYWDVQRMLRYLPKDETALYRARQLLMSRSYGVDNAISKVPAKFKNDVGLRYDRLKWRRRRGRLDSSLEILFKLPNNPIKLVRPDIWWKERSILTRSLIYKKKYVLAYKVCSNHSLSEGPEYAEAEWLSGWVALTFLADANMALQHFKNFYRNVGYPISLSRGAYWTARAYKKLKNNQKHEEWLKEASIYLNTYYGQLAFNELSIDL